MLPNEWKRKYPDPDVRQAFAQTSPLARILEYQPEIMQPGKGKKPFIPWPFQQEILQAHDDKDQAIEKARQCGVSRIKSLEAEFEATKNAGSEVIIVSRNQKQADNFMKYIVQAIHAFKDKEPDYPKIGKLNRSEVTFPELESRILSLPSAPDTGAGYAATKWLFDEVARTPFAHEIYEAAAPTVSQTGGGIHMFSSPKGRTSLLHEVIESRSDNNFHVFSFPWWHVPTYNPVYEHWIRAVRARNHPLAKQLIEEAKKGAWYRANRPRFSKVVWEQEFECNHDTDLDSVFTGGQIKRAFTENYLEQEGHRVADEHWTSEYKGGYRYYQAWDLGRKLDATVGITYSVPLGGASGVNAAKVVEYTRIPPGTSDWSSILWSIRDANTRWHKPACRHDTGGPGDTISEALEDISEPFQFSANQRASQKLNLIEKVRKAFEDGAVCLPRIPQLYREHQRYQWADKGLVTDSVMANLMAVDMFYSPAGVQLQRIPDFNYIQG